MPALRVRARGLTMDRIILDTEIETSPSSLPGGWNDTDKMGLSCAVIYSYKFDRYEFYQKSRIKELRERLLRADEVITYNGWRFDFPMVFGLPGRERVTALSETSRDLLRLIWI